MKGFGPVYKKELYGMFMSPIFYAVAFFFLLLSGVFFDLILKQVVMASYQVAQNPEIAQNVSMTGLFARSFLFNISVIMLFVTPLLTMRLYAEELKSGTIELLYTYPVTDLATVAAKFAACMTTFAILIAATFPGVIMLNSIAGSSWKPILCGYGGLFLLGCSFISLGTFASTLTRNQIVAAIITFGVLLLLWFIGEAKMEVSPTLGSIMGYISVYDHFDGLAKGLLDSRDVLFYVAFSAFFLFLTLRQMSSYRWRG